MRSYNEDRDYEEKSELEEFIDEFKHSRAWKWIKGGAIGALAFATILGSVYIVGADKEGVVTRFGEYINTARPGIHLKIPLIDDVVQQNIMEIKRLEIGFKTEKEGKSGKAPVYSEDTPELIQEQKMLTGDENIAMVEAAVQYRISDPVAYTFNVDRPEGTLKDICEAAIRQVIGDYSIDSTMTTGKIVIQKEIQDKIQEIANKYDMGIQMVAVQLQDVSPPAEVKSAFEDVTNARTEKVTLIDKARGYQNEQIPIARGQAEKMIKEAEGYAEQRIKYAQGGAERFLKLYEQYVKAPGVTEKRIYLEAMEEILPGVKKIIVDKEIGGLIKIIDGLDGESLIKP